MAWNIIVTVTLLAAIMTVGLIHEVVSRWFVERGARRAISELPTIPTIQRDDRGVVTFRSYSDWCKIRSEEGWAPADEFEMGPEDYRELGKDTVPISGKKGRAA